MRSVRSLARMGSWAQFGAMEEDGRGSKEKGGGLKDKAKKKSDGTVGRKKARRRTRRPRTPKAKETTPRNPNPESPPNPANPKTLYKHPRRRRHVCRRQVSKWERRALVRVQWLRLGESTSSYLPTGAGTGAYLDVGGVAQKKRSILGLGLLSTVRLPTVRSGSTASSVVGGANTVGPSFGAPGVAAAFSVSGNNNNNNAANGNRLSVDSAFNNLATTPRPSSVLSNAPSAGSSLHPISTTSTDSRLSQASSVGSSVRWDEEGLETILERRGKERGASAAAEDRQTGQARLQRE